MYYQARFYDPVVGTFVSPDSIVPDGANLFSYNRFMYTVGNPLRYSDPTGHRYEQDYGGGGGVPIHIIAAVVGGTANAAGDVAAQVNNNWDSSRSVSENITDFNTTQTGIAMVYGAASGLNPATGRVASVAFNASLGGAQQVTTDMIVNDEAFSDAFGVDTFFAAVVGGVASIIQGKAPSENPYVATSRIDGEIFDTLGHSTGRDAFSTGGSFWESLTDSAVNIAQTRWLFTGRALTGNTIGNLTTPEVGVCGNIFSCASNSINSWWNGDSDE